ncbi:aminomethyl-transferring glycine dehydrogenase subunit GcvPB [Desulfobotulus sp. H1]|uniref:glycine dehydrogenase (aminomethyl-transferring) n=1 Tax=Desulfobotulus pelophilus TaxID=2823377 RepID=A0ABT3NAE4_9BACT|nr:aminomethyl-transferring glycine dehydrogenase subunit GcvPB [Desulfobotulus pelophilus]MCW7754435.1 aminomethyl-transferring glycine dehydrogenase subunit GcvPB [Desulfobotulus pelophilus]
MKGDYASTGLIFKEPLLWEKGRKGRRAFSMPERDVPEAEALPEGLAGEGPDFPDLSELEVVRHYTRLSQWNFGVDSGMYPLGSCTMKYNPKIHEKLAALPGFAMAHPLLPESLSQGALGLMYELQQMLKAITGLDAVSLQPAAGAQGELCGMMLFEACFRARGEKRHKIIIPDTAHGTNPASAALCGMKPVALRSGADSILHPEDVAALMDEHTAGIMITNPNTLGLFESNMAAIAAIVHEKGGLVYCDGANMNAVMGYVDMKRMGVDVVHFNLHKTFSTPHGGGGPGAGPVCVRAELEPFLPLPRIVKNERGYGLKEDCPLSIGRLHAFYGNFGVLLKAWAYIRSLGADLKKVSELAVLNANYIRSGLKDTYDVAYDGICMHECVFSDKTLKILGVTTLDVAKRLIDLGFHPPTVYFPLVVSGALMVEPTETETREELDRFMEAMRRIREEAEENPEILKSAPLRTKVRRLDETAAARNPCLCGR